MTVKKHDPNRLHLRIRKRVRGSISGDFYDQPVWQVREMKVGFWPGVILFESRTFGDTLAHVIYLQKPSAPARTKYSRMIEKASQ